MDEINETKYSTLTGDGRIYFASDKGRNPGEGSLPLNKEIKLKIGSKVMIRVNIRGTLVSGRDCVELRNGHQGVVVNFDEEGFPLTQHSGDCIAVRLHKFEIKNSENLIIFSRIQIPLMAAHGLTVHKSQGLSLDRVCVDFQRMFACGHAYVALSRCKTLEGLCSEFLDVNCIKADGRVVQFYESLNKA